MKRNNKKLKRKLRNRKKLKEVNVNRYRISVTKSLNKNINAQDVFNSASFPQKKLG